MKAPDQANTDKKVGYLSSLLTQSKAWLRDKTGTIGGAGGAGGAGGFGSSPTAGFIGNIFKGLWKVIKFPLAVAGGTVAAVAFALSKIGRGSSDKKG